MSFNGGWEYRDVIGAADAGVEPSRYYASHYGHSPLAEWQRRIASGEVSLNGAAATDRAVLKAGDMLVWRRPPWNEGRRLDEEVSVIYEDDSIVAVDKPAGLSAMPDGGMLENTLVGWLNRRFGAGAVAPAHRLNRGTSGLVLCAKTPEARASLAAQFLEKTESALGRADGSVQPMEKIYLAITGPLPGFGPGDGLAIEVPIGPVGHPVLGRVFAASPAGKPSRSECEVVATRGGNLLWRVRLITGRPHQIRIHLAAAGAPLLGEPLFLQGGVPRPEALPGDCGYFLRAVKTSFTHPASGRRVAVEVAPRLPW